MTASPSSNLLITKLAAIMADIGTIPKNGTLDLGNRKVPYVQEFDLLEAVRGKLAAAGVMMFTSDEDVQTEQLERVNARGERRQAMMVTLRTKYTLVDGESGCEFSFFGSGQGEDSGDKALYKAKTGALKYAIRETFLIPTGDDPEKDASPRQRATAPRTAPPAILRQAVGASPPMQPGYGEQTPAGCTPEARKWFFGVLKADLGIDHTEAVRLLGVTSLKEDMGDKSFDQILSWTKMAQEKESMLRDAARQPAFSDLANQP